ncbi:hypothetical protein SK128_027904, partial [Halocaridina rubra]
MKWSVPLLVALLLALIVVSESQRRTGARESLTPSRVGRRREGRVRSPGGREKVRAVQEARTRAELDPNWLRCLNSVDVVPEAQHIITGRVEHVSGDKVRVRVKRVLKGDSLPSTIDITNCKGNCCLLRRRDTRLFLLGAPTASSSIGIGRRGRAAATRRGGGGGEDIYPQLATPLHITLKSLFMIRAAIK